ncbi:uncharacterized protein [Musca autumnalis]|uniref:uncharacterized protein n=1 Tax=Musca autumnalis TaxID=221902 RepID=UPI003CE77D42
MTTFSKFFSEHVEQQTCQSLLLHTGSCSEYFLKNLPFYVASTMKYFFPICFASLLINIRKLDKKKFRNCLKYYLYCCLTGGSIGMVTIILVCLMRNIRGRFGLYSLVYLPSLLAGFIINFASGRTQNLCTTALIQSNVESFFRMRNNFLNRAIHDSKMLQTSIFMICSAIIMQGKHLYQTKGFWLLQPNPKVKELENNETGRCQFHSKICCRQHLIEGLRKYFAMGLALDLIGTLVRKVEPSKRGHSVVLAKLKHFRIGTVLLFPAYVGIYRLTHCLLNRCVVYNEDHLHCFAAFVAGICYPLYPQPSLFSYALLHSTRTLWSILEIKNLKTQNEFLKYLLKLPFACIFFPFALANTAHWVCLNPKYASGLGSTILNGITNKYANHLQTVIKNLQ